MEPSDVELSDVEPSEAERQQRVRRMQELFAIARQRYLDAGGDPLRPATEQFMTESERQEFLALSRQVMNEKRRFPRPES